MKWYDCLKFFLVQFFNFFFPRTSQITNSHLKRFRVQIHQLYHSSIDQFINLLFDLLQFHFLVGQPFPVSSSTIPIDSYRSLLPSNTSLNHSSLNSTPPNSRAAILITNNFDQNALALELALQFAELGYHVFIQVSSQLQLSEVIVRWQRLKSLISKRHQRQTQQPTPFSFRHLAHPQRSSRPSIGSLIPLVYLTHDLAQRNDAISTVRAYAKENTLDMISLVHVIHPRMIRRSSPTHPATPILTSPNVSPSRSTRRLSIGARIPSEHFNSRSPVSPIETGKESFSFLFILNLFRWRSPILPSALSSRHALLTLSPSPGGFRLGFLPTYPDPALGLLRELSSRYLQRHPSRHALHHPRLSSHSHRSSWSGCSRLGWWRQSWSGWTGSWWITSAGGDPRTGAQGVPLSPPLKSFWHLAYTRADRNARWFLLLLDFSLSGFPSPSSKPLMPVHHVRLPRPVVSPVIYVASSPSTRIRLSSNSLVCPHSLPGWFNQGSSPQLTWSSFLLNPETQAEDQFNRLEKLRKRSNWWAGFDSGSESSENEYNHQPKRDIRQALVFTLVRAALETRYPRQVYPLRLSGLLSELGECIGKFWGGGV